MNHATTPGGSVATPRRADPFVWACGVLLFAWLLALAVVPIAAFDPWFHFKLGSWIIEHRAVPDHNVFMYTTPDYPWIDHSWLSDVLFYLAFQVTGRAGLPLLVALLIAGSAGLLWRLWFRLGGRADLAPVAFGLALLGASLRFALRPELFTFLGLSLLLTVLYLHRFRSERVLWGLPALAVPWASLHGAWASGILLMWLFVGAEAVASAVAWVRHRSAAGTRPRGLALWAAVATAATLLNPYGYHWFEAVDPRRLREFAQYINEWQPTFGAGPLSPYAVALLVALFALLAVTAMTIFAAGRRASLSSVVLLLVAVVMAFSARRHFGLVAWICLPILAVESRAAMEGWWGRALARGERLSGGRARTIYRAAVLVALAAGAGHLWTAGITPERRPGLGVDMTRLPGGAVGFIEEARLRGPMFNMSNQGAYLIWKLFPRDKVFIDGLNAYPLSWYREYHEMINGREDAARVIARWKIRYFLLDEEQLAPLAQPQGLIDRLVALGWRLVYYDGHDLIYVPDIPENHNLIARHAYEYLRPGGIDPAAYRDHPAELTAEVERMIAGNPQSPYARDTAGWVRLGLGDPVGAAGEFEAEARLARNPMSAYLGLAQVSAAMGRDESAVDYFRKALRLSSGDPGIHRALAEAYERRGRFREAVAERKRVVRVEPQNPAAHYELAGTYRAYARQPGAPKERLLRDAVSELRIAFELSPNPEIAYALGAVFMAMDQPRAAIREFTLGIELDAAWPGNYRGLARAYEALNDREAAIRAWRDFLSREPDPTSAAEARARLKALQSP